MLYVVLHISKHVKQWKKSRGHHFVPECNYAQKSRTNQSMSIFLLFSSTAVCLVSLAAVFLRHHATLLLTIATNEWSHHRISSMSK